MRLPLEITSVRYENLVKRNSDDSRHFIFWRRKQKQIDKSSCYTQIPLSHKEFVCKLWTAAYPARMAPIGVKLGQNAFQTIPDISFFDAENQKKMPNFEWPFTPRIWLRSASNFGKMRFRRFPTFHFSTPKKKVDDFFFALLPTSVGSNGQLLPTSLLPNATAYRHAQACEFRFGSVITIS